MDYFIAGASGLKLIRSIRKGECDLKLVKSDVKTPTPLASHYLTLRTLGIPELCNLLDVSEKSPLHLLAPNKVSRRRPRGIRISMRSQARGGTPYFEVVPSKDGSESKYLPPGVRVFVESPSSIVISMAYELAKRERMERSSHQESTLRLLKLCLELCGTFTLDPHNPLTERATFWIEPVLTKDNLVADVLSVHKLMGLSLAKEVLSMVYERSGSPGESFAGCALFCPTEYGGLCVGDFEANAELNLSRHQYRMLSFKKLTPDFYMPKYKIAIEYNGEDHEKSDNPKRDRMRMNGYSMLACKAFVITRNEVRSLGAFNTCARQIVGAIESYEGPSASRRFKKLMKDKDFVARQKVLFEVYRTHLEFDD